MRDENGGLPTLDRRAATWLDGSAELIDVSQLSAEAFHQAARW